MANLELSYTHSRNGKPELLEQIQTAIDAAPAPEPFPGYEDCHTIKWPKQRSVDGEMVIDGLISSHTLERARNGGWSTRTLASGRVHFEDLKRAKTWLEGYLRGKYEPHERGSYYFHQYRARDNF